ncbi:MAG: hypothetical protein IJX26_03445, partial [Clostridia bacterium]|nr:hypothetical protein [Clostridia bacterium]
IGQSLLYFSLCLSTILLLWALCLILFVDAIIVGFILGGVFAIIVLPSFIKNLKELNRILKLLNSKPEYYLEIYGDNIKVNALDKEYTINFKYIERLNYSYDRPLISANFLLMYGNHKYKLNVNSKKLKSTYTMFDLSNEFVQGLKTNKKTKHGILLITTNDYFFALPEIENVEECFKELKELINYNPTIKENEKDEYQEFSGKIYLNIMESKKKEKLDYNEEKFISLTNMIEGSFEFDLEKNIQYLEELGATNYVNLLKEAKTDIDNSRINNKIINGEDFAVQLFNKIKILDEKEPFYKTYLIPFAKEYLSKYIN